MTEHKVAPVAERTIKVTIGKINTPVNDGTVCGCNVNLSSAYEDTARPGKVRRWGNAKRLGGRDWGRYINVNTIKQTRSDNAIVIQNKTSVNKSIGSPHFGTAT